MHNSKNGREESRFPGLNHYSGNRRLPLMLFIISNNFFMRQAKIHTPVSTKITVIPY